VIAHVFVGLVLICARAEVPDPSQCTRAVASSIINVPGESPTMIGCAMLTLAFMGGLESASVGEGYYPKATCVMKPESRA
jgi:hypothetical protein